MIPDTMPARVVIEDVWPRVDDGEVAIRRVVGDTVEVYADVFADGAVGVRACVRYQRPGQRSWQRVAMEPIGNDRWRASFPVEEAGEYRYQVEGWVDPYRTWRNLLERRVAVGSARPIDLQEGSAILSALSRRTAGRVGGRLQAHAEALGRAAQGSLQDGLRIALENGAERLLAVTPDRAGVSYSSGTLRVAVDPIEAQHSAWYELFPRSTSTLASRPGTLRDLTERLGYIAELGFDVVYLPPIHPIGRTNRRGPNNSFPAPPGAPGSPWAIGAAEGGHTTIDPGLGTQEDFRRLLEEGRRLGLAIALDLALQCSPDHPWVREHPDWFQHLPDGAIRPAENPPKRYDDIYPLDFGTDDWKNLWRELKGIVDFWVGRGVRWFRVDNPHTKPFEFWRWLIGETRREHPDVMFLAEAFTRPKVMYRLAKVGFTHSYTYFTWRTTREEIEGYFGEIGRGAVGEFFRPHLWPNTPDILTEQLHTGGRAAFVHRLVLAATLSSHYGLYGPAYELMEHQPLHAGAEEYRDSEKYQVRHWPKPGAASLAPVIQRLNAIRRAHPALRTGRRLAFHATDNDRLVAYSRRTQDRSDVVLVIVNLDSESVQSGWTSLDLGELGLPADTPYGLHDLLSDAAYRWKGHRNFVRLDPAVMPAHVIAIDTPPAEPEAVARSA